MTDILDRLRKTGAYECTDPAYAATDLELEAADEIERLKEALETCRELRRGDAAMLQTYMARVQR